jgi:hypothetical protein
MKVQNTIEAIRVMQAFVDGRPIECAEVHKLNWGETLSPVWNWNNFTYRIKPASKLRPWNADEVPLGAWIRLKNLNKTRSMIVSVAAFNLEIAFNEYEHSTDGGKTWKPCGVEEVE